VIAALASLLALLAAAPTAEPEAPGAAPAAATEPAAPLAEEPAPPPRIGLADLAPAFVAGTPAAEGKAAYDAGQHAEAVVDLARAPQPEAAYVRALALVELGRHAEALRVLDGLATRLPELSDRLRFLEGKALAGAGRREEALAAWAAVPDGSLLAPEARLSRARLAAAEGGREAALAALSPLLGLAGPTDLSRPDAGATALLLAGRLRSAGRPADLAGARRDLLACWVAHPLSPESPECLAALRALPVPFGVAPGPVEAVQRAENLLEQNRNGLAIALLAPLAAAPGVAADDGPLSCRIRSALGRAERRERNYPRAIALLEPVAERCKDPVVKVRALYVLAGAVAIAGDRTKGVALYRRLAREFPGHPYADDALLYAAQLLARDGQVGEARQVLRALVDGRADGDQRGEARFLDAWLARRAGDVEAALEALAAVERDAGGAEPYDRARAAYWRGRFLWDQGDEGRAGAREAWAELAASYPTDYYGLLARARLAEAGEPAPRTKVPPAPTGARYDPGALRDDPHLRAGLALFRAGFPRAAVEELLAVPLPRLRPGEPLDPVLLVADVLDRAGDPRGAHQLLRTRAREAFRRAPDAENLRAWLIAYPPAYRDEVERAARAAGVPPDLVQGLMREESALDPRVVSPAGAVGLTQLMLPTAQQVAARLKLARPTRSDLAQPALNLRLGAQYLGDLMRRFQGEVPLALAAYNAGAGAVARWQEAAPDLPLDEFVEQIPVEETRGYVKRVLRSYAAYAALYGDGGPGAAELLRVAKP
jgi:soluble lytic murein transglycosylase